ncbi:RNA exonuclease 4 isoform X2 [Fukomys damarensis]|uniref:RNA exonuclease 4 isoform X2 n=1 Tax=Fukomys damarensis TaxID=885580 RepID=UPI001454EBE5|nr:RNA exonuclease 4 isoform X2 [Fukomys damarensis]
MKAKTSERTPSLPMAQPGPARKLTGKKNKKKRFWKKKAQGGSKKAGSAPKGVAGRPPKAPEDFSQNWRALQELLKQKSQVSEKPPVSQMDPQKQPKIIQQNRKISEKRKEDEKPKEKDQAGTGHSVPSASKRDRKVPLPATKTNGTEYKKGAQKRTNGDISSKPGDIKHKKRKAEEAAAASSSAPPTEEDIWFDDVDPADIEAAIGPEAARIARKQLGQKESSISLEKEQAFDGLTKALALDCEMVGVGPQGEESIAARVSLVNQYGKCVYDKFIKPTEPVTDYRTAVSGVRPEHLGQGEELEVVQSEVAEMLKGRILVGHALHNDLKVLFLDHPKKKIRDTQKYKPFKRNLEERKALSEAAFGEDPGDQSPAGRALFNPGRPGSNEAVHHGEEGLGEHRPGQAPPGPCPAPPR